MQRRLLSLLLAAALMPGAVRAAPPEAALVVELRWVDSLLPPAAQAGVRDGAVVVGTAGTVMPSAGGTVTSTARPAPLPGQRLTVLNGQTATLELTTREPLQWVESVVELDPAGGAPRIYASPRSGEQRRVQRFGVTPRWPGGRAAARVTFDLADGEQALQSTLDLPLDRWTTVARSGMAAAPAPRGTFSSADAAGRPGRELQLRVSLQP